MIKVSLESKFLTVIPVKNFNPDNLSMGMPRQLKIETFNNCLLSDMQLKALWLLSSKVKLVHFVSNYVLIYLDNWKKCLAPTTDDCLKLSFKVLKLLAKNFLITLKDT